MKTMRVQPWGEDQGDHVVINVTDFDPKVHVRIDAKAAPMSEAPAEPVKSDPVVSHAVAIPADWQALGWPQKRSLASKLTDEPINNGATADRVIAAELAKREG